MSFLTIAEAAQQLGENDPITLAVAAKLAYPDGSMGVAGLRRELRKAGIEPLRQCGKHYTTLAEIREMQRICRDAAKAHASITEKPNAGKMATEGKASGSSETERSHEAQAAALRIVKGLSKRSQTTSPESTKSQESGTVIHPKFSSQT